jgi:transcriptional regulator with XRE-family HTH domain
LSGLCLLGRVVVMTVSEESVGDLVRRWRERRHRSQLDVSLAANLSARHLSFIETGRATPSRDMIERLCGELDVPLRDRNAFHLAAGFAPAHRERPLAELGAAAAAVETILAGSEPNPAVAVNVRWDVLAANRPMRALLAAVPARLAGPPLNILRATLHPEGLAGQLRNYGQWRAHVVRRVQRQLDRTAAVGLAELLEEIQGYPIPDGGTATAPVADDLLMPMLVTTAHGDLSLGYALTVFGAPRDVTLDEIAIETMFPTDAATAGVLRSLAMP